MVSKAATVTAAKKKVADTAKHSLPGLYAKLEKANADALKHAAAAKKASAAARAASKTIRQLIVGDPK